LIINSGGETVGRTRAELLVGTVDQPQQWITSGWGVSENGGRRARYYSHSAAGRKLKKAVKDWDRMAAFITRVVQGV
jgi:hypothetical protein